VASVIACVCFDVTVLEHPPYSPDLAPSDFILFPKIKKILKGRHFDIDDIRSNTTADLKVIPQNPFQNYSSVHSFRRRKATAVIYSNLSRRVREIYCQTTYTPQRSDNRKPDGSTSLETT
jgi:hypothetical protein